LPLHFRSSWK